MQGIQGPGHQCIQQLCLANPSGQLDQSHSGETSTKGGLRRIIALDGEQKEVEAFLLYAEDSAKRKIPLSEMKVDTQDMSVDDLKLINPHLSKFLQHYDYFKHSIERLKGEQEIELQDALKDLHLYIEEHADTVAEFAQICRVRLLNSGFNGQLSREEGELFNTFSRFLLSAGINLECEEKDIEKNDFYHITLTDCYIRNLLEHHRSLLGVRENNKVKAFYYSLVDFCVDYHFKSEGGIDGEVMPQLSFLHGTNTGCILGLKALDGRMLPRGYLQRLSVPVLTGENSIPIGVSINTSNISSVGLEFAETAIAYTKKLYFLFLP